MGRRVFGRTPKLPIGTAGNPFFEDFMIPAEAPAAKPHSLLAALYKIRQSSLTADFQSKVNTTPIRRVRHAKTDDFFGEDGCALFRRIAKTKLTRDGQGMG